MNTKFLIKKFKSKSLILRPNTLKFLKENWPPLSQSQHKPFMEKVATLSLKYLQDKGAENNIVDVEVVKAIFSEISRTGQAEHNQSQPIQEETNNDRNLKPDAVKFQTEQKMKFKKLRSSLVLISNFQTQDLFNPKQGHPFTDRTRPRYAVVEPSQRSQIDDFSGQLSDLLQQRAKRNTQGTGTLGFGNNQQKNTECHQQDEALSRGMTWKGIQVVHSILENPNTHKDFLKLQYRGLLHSLKSSFNFDIKNHFVVEARDDISADYQNQIIHTEMDRFFHNYIDPVGIGEIFKSLKLKQPQTLSEIGSVFGISQQKSLVGFLNEKKNQFFLEGPFSEVQLDLVYCRNCYGYFIKGSFICVTGILKNNKFVVFEASMPNTAMILDEQTLERVHQR